MHELAAEEDDEDKGWFRNPIFLLWELTMPAPHRHWSLFGMSIFWIAVLTYVMVDACNRMGCLLGMPVIVMGLIFLAAGTSVPDAMGSIAVAKQGEGNMAVSNAVGSNVFDIMLGLGVPWTMRIAMGNRVLFAGVTNDLFYYIATLVGVLLFFVGSLRVMGWKLNTRMGGCLLSMYLVYVVMSLIRAYV